MFHNFASDEYGKIIILNGVPRSGKSSISAEIQKSFDGVWINLGVDNYMKTIPEQFQPGIGLRPGGERPDLEPIIVKLYQSLYESIAAHSRNGINVVADFGHHNSYSTKLNILSNCARIIKDYPAILVGVHCPIEIIMERRINTWKSGYEKDGSIPKPIMLWDQSVHKDSIYDIEVDTSKYTPKQCAAFIYEYMTGNNNINAIKQLADRVNS
jgi:chloramphenicol 3-O phosphotransferase